MSAPRTASTAATTPRPRYAQGDLVAGKYLLERLIGEGGMGAIWLALNMDLDAPVAIKLLAGESAPVEAAARLRREARAEARLEHRAIVRVFDCGETESGDPFIVMEFLEGQSLADLLDEERTISVVAAIKMLLPVIDGMAVAHEEGIIHRDIKPENIFLSRGPRHVQPKVVDFGIAKLDRWDPNPGITIQGTVIGSPSYMAPEQARGLNDVDHRADIWAVCAVLYEAVAGGAPFRGDTYNAILRSIVEDDITPLTKVGPDEAALWTVLERGFAKDRTRRFQTMRELGVALANVLVRRGITEDICGDPIAAVWGVPALPGDGASLVGAAGSPPSPLSPLRQPVLAAQLPEWGSTGSQQVAPTSTSGVVTPSPAARERRRGVFSPSTLAAVVLAALAAAGLAMWREPAPRETTAALSLDRPNAPAPNAPPAPAPESSIAPPNVAPVAVAVVQPRTNAPSSVQGPRKPKATKRHGWPQAPESSKIRSAQADDSQERIIRADAATLTELGLKAPYR